MASLSISFTTAVIRRRFPPPSNPSLLLRSRISLPLRRPLPSTVRDGRVSARGIRAGVQLPAISPGNGVETDRIPSDVRDRTMDALDHYGRRVTIGDVAGRAGLKMNEAERALQAIAADTDGFLEVSNEGDVLYVFPREYRSKLVTKSFRMKIEPFVNKSKSAAEYLIRASFGVTLIASIVLVFTTIVAVMSSSKSDGDNRGRRSGRSYSSDFTFFFRMSDLLWYLDPYYPKRQQMKSGEQMNFIESVFSFVFGDGNPNEGFEDARWKLIGQYISSNGGVVSAEELAPYLDVSPDNESFGDESYMLPVLLRFDGHPEVDDEGYILYRFPSLQRTAVPERVGRKEYVGRRWAEQAGGTEKFVKEKKWVFSKTKLSEKAMVIGLGGLNLFGVIILGTMLKSMTVTPDTKGLISFVSGIFPILQTYAASFFAIPLFRWFLLLKMNKEIETRNKARQKRAKALEMPDMTLRRKLLNARDMAERTVITPERIVYSTEKDVDDQDYEARDWDQRFKEIERAD